MMALQEQEARTTEAFNRENRELAEAAQQTIKTLNGMLSQKKNQLETKETMIQNLRNQV